MTIYKDKLRKPTSCYTCIHNTIIDEDTPREWWGCDEYNGVPVGTNPPYDTPCTFYRQRKEK